MDAGMMHAADKPWMARPPSSMPLVSEPRPSGVSVMTREPRMESHNPA